MHPSPYTSTTHVAGSKTCCSRAKHVALRPLYTHPRDHQVGHVIIYCIPKEKPLTGLGTKLLTKQRHRFLIELIKNFQLYFVRRKARAII